jgi:hypothetical protein
LLLLVVRRESWIAGRRQRRGRGANVKCGRRRRVENLSAQTSLRLAVGWLLRLRGLRRITGGQARQKTGPVAFAGGIGETEQISERQWDITIAASAGR